MTGELEIVLYGSLRGMQSVSPKPANKLLLPTKAKTLPAVLDQIGITADAVQLVMLNHRAVPGQTTVQLGDRLALFPKEYQIVVDWLDYRF